MGKDRSEPMRTGEEMAGDTPGNRGVRSAADAAGRVEWPDPQEAERRVLRIQSKFHD